MPREWSSRAPVLCSTSLPYHHPPFTPCAMLFLACKFQPCFCPLQLSTYLEKIENAAAFLRQPANVGDPVAQVLKSEFVVGLLNNVGAWGYEVSCGPCVWRNQPSCRCHALAHTVATRTTMGTSLAICSCYGCRFIIVFTDHSSPLLPPVAVRNLGYPRQALFWGWLVARQGSRD